MGKSVVTRHYSTDAKSRDKRSHDACGKDARSTGISMFDVDVVAADIMIRSKNFPHSQHDDKKQKAERSNTAIYEHV